MSGRSARGASGVQVGLEEGLELRESALGSGSLGGEGDDVAVTGAQRHNAQDGGGVAEKGVPVTIAKEGGAAVDASSILGVMTLGAGFGDVVTLASDADGAEAALEDLKALLETDLDA